MKKALILAIAIVAVSALVGCNRKAQLPSQNFVGRWSNDNDNETYLEIRYINAEENKIVFEWFIVRTMFSEGTAWLEDGKIKFVLDDYGVSGTMEFNENGVSITPYDTVEYLAVAGHTFLYKEKIAIGVTDFPLPPVIDLYQYQNEYSPSQSDYRIWGWSKDGKVAYSNNLSDGGETTIYVQILNLVDDKFIWHNSLNVSYAADGNELQPGTLYDEFRKVCIQNGIEFVQAEYRRLPINHNGRTYNVIEEKTKTTMEVEMVVSYRIVIETQGKRKTVSEANMAAWGIYDVFSLGYFISPFENRALLVMGEHIRGGMVMTGPVGFDLDSGFTDVVTFTVEEATERTHQGGYIFEDEGVGAYIAITPSGMVTDFRYVSIGFHGDGLFEDITLFERPYLAGGQSFNVAWQASSIPHRGISYIDGGQRKYFYLREDGMDGSIKLVEFAPTPR